MDGQRLRISSGTEHVRRDERAPIVVVTELRKRFELTKTAGLVFDLMWSACGGAESNGRAFRALEIAVAVGCDPKSVTRAWLQLRGLKLVTLVHQGGRGRDPVYAVHDPLRVAHERVVAAPAEEQTSFRFDDELEAEGMPGILSDKMPAIAERETPPVTESAAAQGLSDNLSDKMPGIRPFMNHEMNELKSSSHEGAAARGADPTGSEPPRDASLLEEHRRIAALRRLESERRVIALPLPNVGSLVARHAPRAAHGRDSPELVLDAAAGSEPGQVAELAGKLRVQLADPECDERLLIDIARDVVAGVLPFETVKAWLKRINDAQRRGYEFKEGPGAVLRSNYKKFPRGAR